ncbi:5-methylcytosine rRNA methyltransferase NSUN4 [Bienertia sinuspersici]
MFDFETFFNGYHRRNPQDQRDKLFITMCLVNGKHYLMIVDSGSCTNVVFNTMVEDANLPLPEHPRPYKHSLLNDDKGLRVKKQALLSFRIGGYQDQFWCNVLPMTACSILMGRPWQYDRKVMHNGRDNIYSVLERKERVVLKPLQPKSKEAPTTNNNDHAHVCFNSYRDEILDSTANKKRKA